MTEGHNVAVYGVLLAVVLVGAAGFYFTMNAQSGAPQIVYVTGGQAQVSAPTGPFSLSGHGITGRDVEQFGTATITVTSQLDLVCPKCTITCTGHVDQGEQEAHFYTCGDAANIGGTLVCDGGTVTDATTCSESGANDGAFFLYNQGANAQLWATLVSLTLNGVPSTTIYLDNILYNSLEAVINGNGCTDVGCNNCPAPNTLGCEKALAGNLFGYADTVVECDNFETSGEGICECFSIHITEPDDIHEVKNSGVIEFVIKKTLVEPADPTCAGGP